MGGHLWRACYEKTITACAGDGLVNCDCLPKETSDECYPVFCMSKRLQVFHWIRSGKCSQGRTRRRSLLSQHLPIQSCPIQLSEITVNSWDSFYYCRRVKLIGWQLFVRRVTTISPTIDFWNGDVSRKCFPRQLKRSRPSQLHYLFHQGHTGDAKEDAHVVNVTLMIWETKARRFQVQMRKDSNGCV